MIEDQQTVRQHDRRGDKDCEEHARIEQPAPELALRQDGDDRCDRQQDEVVFRDDPDADGDAGQRVVQGIGSAAPG